MSSTPVGTDIAKRKFDAAAYVNGKYKTKVFDNDRAGIARFLEWLAAFADPHVCLEATGQYGELLATMLADAGVRVSVVNPARIAAFAKTELTRGKTDKGDAKLIARFCALHQPPEWEPPPRNIRQLQALVRRLESLLEMQQMERNRLERAEGTVTASLEAVLATLAEQIERTREQIRHHVDDDPDLRSRRDLLDSIPGLGGATIPVLLATLGDVSRFHSHKQVSAFGGLNPKERQSGQWKGTTRLSKTGDALIRRALYMPALVAGRHNPLIKALRQRLLARGKHPMAVVGAMMRKLLTIAYGVLKSGKPFDPQLAVAA
jgi:transposase